MVYQGVDPVFSLDITTADRQRVRQKYGLPGMLHNFRGHGIAPQEPAAGSPGGLHGCLSRVQLVVVGRLSGDYGRRFHEAVAALGLSQRVKCLTDVPMAGRLARALQLCPCGFLHISLRGLRSSVVEAPWLRHSSGGVLGSCLEEAGGEGAVYVHFRRCRGICRGRRARLIDDTVAHDTVAAAVAGAISAVSAPRISPRSTMASYRKAIIDFMS